MWVIKLLGAAHERVRSKVIVIIINYNKTITIFMVLSSWLRAIARVYLVYLMTAMWPSTLRSSQQTWAVITVIIGSCRPHPPSPIISSVCVTGRMRVIGELPSLSVVVSDSRLCDILSLVSSIPLPQGGAPAPVDEDEDLHLVTSTGSCQLWCCRSRTSINNNNITICIVPWDPKMQRCW